MTRHHDLVVPEGTAYVLTRARVPACFLRPVPEGAARDDEGCVLVDIAVEGGAVKWVQPSGRAGATLPEVDVEGRQVWAALVDMHVHLDKGQVIPRVRPDGTLHGGSTRTLADRARWTEDDIAARMRFGMKAAYAHGVGAIRTHLDSHEGMAERSWTVFRAMREEWRGRVELQAVGLAPLAAFRGDWGRRLADLVAQSGGVLGGVTDALGSFEGALGATLDPLLDAFLNAAAERGLDVDLHVDQSESVAHFSLPNIARAVMRTRFKGRVLCGHCVNLALQPEAVIRSTIELSVAAGLTFAAMPTPMMYLQDRKPGRTPRWRGVTLAQELLDAGLAVGIGGDNCRDAWFPFGDHDMLDTWQQSVRVFQIDDPLWRSLAMAGPTPADVIRSESAGWIAPGRPANLILLRARTLNEAMCRPQADRIVVSRGRRVSDPVPDYEELDGLMG